MEHQLSDVGTEIAMNTNSVFFHFNITLLHNFKTMIFFYLVFCSVFLQKEKKRKKYHFTLSCYSRHLYRIHSDIRPILVISDASQKVTEKSPIKFSYEAFSVFDSLPTMQGRNIVYGDA